DVVMTQAERVCIIMAIACDRIAAGGSGAVGFEPEEAPSLRSHPYIALAVLRYYIHKCAECLPLAECAAIAEVSYQVAGGVEEIDPSIAGSSPQISVFVLIECPYLVLRV